MKKEDFPILKSNQLIYLDNAATAQKPQSVIDSLVKFYSEQNSNVHRGIYKLSEDATQAFEKSRENIAKFINANTNEVFFTSGTTEGINIIANLIDHNEFIDSNTSILVSVMEHHSNLLPWQQLARIREIPLLFNVITEDYKLDLEDLYKKIDDYKPQVIALTQASNVLGTINPIKEIIKKIRELSPLSIVVIDAAQSIAHLNIDVKDLDCDFLVFSAHKLYGPTGIGIVYAKSKILESMTPFKLGGGIVNKVTEDDVTFNESPNRFEAGTPNIAGALGLSAAIDYINSIGKEEIFIYEKDLANYALTQLKTVDGLKLYSPSDSVNNIGVFSFTLYGIHSHDLAQILDESNICSRAGHHCAQILHREVLGISATLRVSLAFYNEKSDIDKLVEALETAKKKFKKD